MSSVCLTVGVRAPPSSSDPAGGHGSFKEGGLSGVDMGRVYAALLVAMKDYTLDSRGDVGALVREAAMTGLCQLATLLVNSAHPQLFTPDM